MSFKEKLKNNNSILIFVCFLSRLINSIVKFNFYYKNNELRIHKLTFFKNVKIKMNGVNNIIITKGRCNLKNVQIQINGNNNQLIVSEGVKFYDKAYILFEGDNCKISIGKKTTIGSSNLFCAESNTKIEIGEDCMLSREVVISTGDFHSIIDLESNKRINKSMDVKIGNHIWVGNSVIISKGVSIANNSIIGLSTIVTKSFEEENVILAGIPAKVISKNKDWDRKKLPINNLV